MQLIQYILCCGTSISVRPPSLLVEAWFPFALQSHMLPAVLHLESLKMATQCWMSKMRNFFPYLSLFQSVEAVTFTTSNVDNHDSWKTRNLVLYHFRVFCFGVWYKEMILKGCFAGMITFFLYVSLVAHVMQRGNAARVIALFCQILRSSHLTNHEIVSRWSTATNEVALDGKGHLTSLWPSFHHWGKSPLMSRYHLTTTELPELYFKIP